MLFGDIWEVKLLFVLTEVEKRETTFPFLKISFEVVVQ